MTDDNTPDPGAGGDLDTAAAEYVLGLLGPEERRAMEARLADDEAAQAAVTAWQDRLQPLADAVEAVEPGDHVFEAASAAIRGEPQPGTVTIRADEGEWQQIFDGVYRKTLLVDADAGTESYLLRIEPGGVCPAHGHDATEECLILEGEMRIGEARLRAGDYHAAPATVPHLPVTSETGVLLYVRSAA